MLYDSYCFVLCLLNLKTYVLGNGQVMPTAGWIPMT